MRIGYPQRPMKLRNIAIIAHVDHGKTTLVDQMLRQSGTFRDNQALTERAMDSNDLEKERGITILAKCTSIVWNDTRINVVDTPGHADFGGEVERILGMVDGVVLLVDAAEGPLPQTKFVLGKALRKGIRPILLVNKVDRHDARPDEVHDEVFDLFAALDAEPQQLDFPTLFGSGRDGWMSLAHDQKTEDLSSLFELIVNHVPAPNVNPNAAFSMLATIIEPNPFLGRILTGRIATGTLKANQQIKALTRTGEQIEIGRATKILAFRGLERVPVDEAVAGDIIALAGLEKATVADTICDMSVAEAIPAQPIDPPTISMRFSVNDSPLAGTEGSKVTSRMIRDRLFKEAEANVALRVRETETADAFEVAGRGELQLGILIETMRREGFELSISRPQVVMQEEGGQKLEPIEEVVIDVDEEHASTVIGSLSERKADLIEQRPSGAGKQRLVFYAPSRGLIGYHGQFLTETRGTGVMNRLFHEYAPFKGTMAGRRNGVLISNAQGDSVAYAIFNLEDRGQFLIGSGEKVYQGMIVAEHSRDNDLEVNVMKAKQLSNVRAAGKDEAIRLTTPMQMPLEKALAYIQDDELVEVTPKNIRLRKRLLDPNDRKRVERQSA
jgi:GTP-binding protein